MNNNYIPSSVEELYQMMKDEFFKGNITLEENKIIKWTYNEQLEITIIFNNQPNESYVSYTGNIENLGGHDHIPNDELWKCLKKLNRGTIIGKKKKSLFGKKDKYYFVEEDNILDNSVYFYIKGKSYEIGTSSFLYSFFSTIAHNLEKRNWGSKYPIIMNELYQGKLSYENIEKAILELQDIKNELKKYSPNQVIWNYEDPSILPPWKDNIAQTITDLSNYFITSDGKDLINLLFEVLEKAKSNLSSIEIE